MTHTRGKEPDEEYPNGFDDVQPALTTREARILSFIKTKILETEIAPSGREIALAMGYQRADAIQSALLSLVRKQAIKLGTGQHRAIQVIDRDEAPIITPGSTLKPDETVDCTMRVVDRMPGALVRRLDKPADFFLRIDGVGLKALGVGQGDLVAVQRTIELETGSVLVARDERGAWVCREARVTHDRHLVLAPAIPLGVQRENTRGTAEQRAAVRIEGVLTGAVRTRPIKRHEGGTSAETPDAESRAVSRRQIAPEPRPKRAPSPQQAAVLNIIRKHMRLRGMAPSLPEMAKQLGRTSGSVQTHLAELIARGWIQKTPGVQRSWWPTDMGTIPIVDPDGKPKHGGQELENCPIIERMPSVVAEELDPRPDFLITVTKNIGEALGLNHNDLIAIAAATEADEGEIVIARVGEMRHLVCGELRRHDAHRQALRPVAEGTKAPAVVVDTARGALRIEGLITGCVTFRGLEASRRHSGER